MKKYRVLMIFSEGTFTYGTYSDRHQANEIALKLREERGCQTWVEEAEDE